MLNWDRHYAGRAGRITASEIRELLNKYDYPGDTAKVVRGEEEILLTENQSIYVPLGAVHRLENPGRVPMVLIEVQTGAYLGEDDIIRYEDIYARGDEKGSAR